MTERRYTRILKCKSCGEEFVVTVDAQEYLAKKGKSSNFLFCRTCYVEARKDSRGAGAKENCSAKPIISNVDI